MNSPDAAITITRAEVELRLCRTFTDPQWETFRAHALDAALDGLYDLAEDIIEFGRPGQPLSADSAEPGDVILDQDRNGPYTVIDVDMPGPYLRFAFRCSDGSEFSDTAAMEARFTCLGGPSYNGAWD